MEDAHRIHERIDAVFPAAYRHYVFQTTVREGGCEWTVEIWDRKGQLVLRSGPMSNLDALLETLVPVPAVEPVPGPVPAHLA